MTKKRSPRLTDKELDALLEAVGHRLAGEMDEDDDDAGALERAQAKLWQMKAARDEKPTTTRRS